MKNTALPGIIILAILVAFASSVSSAADAPVNLDLKNISLKDAIGALFDGRGLNYYIQPGVTGKIVELKLTGVTFDQALRALMDAAELTYTIQDGAYVIGPVRRQAKSTATVPAASPPPAAAQPGPSDQRQAQAAPGTQPQQSGNVSVQQGGPSQQVVVSQPATPSYYGQPYGGPYGGGYGPYRIGGAYFTGGYGWSPYVIAGGPSSVMSLGPGYPPPPGWVSPDVLRFLRGVYSVTPTPYFIPGY